MDTRRMLARGLVLAGLGFAALFAAQGLLEWWRLGAPGLDATSWADQNNAKLLDALSPMARAYNNVLAMLIATIGLAIPLTANMHTPKLIELFLRDRVNQVMLVVCAFGAANVLFVAYLVGPAFAPIWAYRFAVYGALALWAALIPYFFYVIRFLDPSNIVARIRHEAERGIDRALRPGEDLEVVQDVAHDWLNRLGTLVAKAVDRGDRGVAREGVWALKRIADHYGARKARMPGRWFLVDRKDFVGLADEAIEVVNAERTWLEHKIGKQLYVAFLAALGKSQDAVSAICDATRVIARNAADRGDEQAVMLMVRFFNSYLREAIKKKDPHAIFDVFYQYRLVGIEAAKARPQLLEEIGHYFRYYADFATKGGVPIVAPLAGFDLGWLVARAHEQESPAAPTILGHLLALDHAPGGAVVGLLVKAKLAMGGYFLETGREEAAERVRANLEGVPRETLRALGEELCGVTDPVFWEVTARQVNVEYLPPARREHTRAFVARMT